MAIGSGVLLPGVAENPALPIRSALAYTTGLGYRPTCDKKNFSLYFTHLPRRPLWTDLRLIWHRRSCPGRNHLWQFFCKSVKGVRFYRGSNFGIPHWLRQSPLIQCCATARLWYVNLNTCV